MEANLQLTFGILIVTIILFISDKFRLDLVALMSLLSLLLLDLVSVQEGLAGFSNPIVVMIAALFVIGGALMQTGVADSVGQLLAQLMNKYQNWVLSILMLTVATLSAFMSSTGTVAVFMPIVISLAAQLKIPTSKLLIPLSFSSLIGGMLTLIGTPPNIVVSNELAANQLEPFGFFDFTPVGLIVLLVGILYMNFLGQRLLPARSASTLSLSYATDEPDVKMMLKNYGVSNLLFRLKIEENSFFNYHQLKDLKLPEKYQISILSVRRNHKVHMAGPDTLFETGDILIVEGSAENVMQMVKEHNLSIVERKRSTDLLASDHHGLVEVILTPRSRLIGKTIQSSNFREKYGLHVLSLWRSGEKINDNYINTKLKFADLLLVYGAWSKIGILQTERRDFVVASQPQSLRIKQKVDLKQILAVLIVVIMLILMTFKVLATVTAILLAAVAMILFRCLNMEEAYRSINWESLVLIACMLPMATALQKTGGIEFISETLASNLGGMGVSVILMSLFLLTSILSQFMSNTATTVLLAPVALQLALSLGYSPESFLMVIAVAASTAFATPIASPVNSMILGPGNYTFMDFVKVGVPLQLLIMVVALIVVPIFFPLT